MQETKTFENMGSKVRRHEHEVMALPIPRLCTKIMIGVSPGNYPLVVERVLTKVLKITDPSFRYSSTTSIDS